MKTNFGPLCVAALAPLVLSLSACGIEGNDESIVDPEPDGPVLDWSPEGQGQEPDAVDAEEVAAAAQPLESWRTGRTRENYPGVVFLKWAIREIDGLGVGDATCSGTLIAPDLILTSAHCVDYLGANKAIVQLAVQGMVNGERRCISDFTGVDPTCLGADAERKDPVAQADDMARFQIFKNTRYNFWEATYDMAVLKLLSTDEKGAPQMEDPDYYRRPYLAGYGPDHECDEGGARSGKAPCYARVLTGAPGGWFEWNGWGVTGATTYDQGSKLNFGLTRVDWVRSGHFGRDTEQSDLERTCYGDDGGGAMAHNSAWGFNNKRTYVMGINQGPLHGYCSPAGDKERWTRVDQHLWLIMNSSSLPADHDPGAGRVCEESSINGHAYLKCWNTTDWRR